MANIRIRIENYKAIANADITLSDLTVLAGVNASGKSTVASLFHSIVEINRNRFYYAEIQSIIKNNLIKKLWQMLKLFEGLDEFGVKLPDDAWTWRQNVLERNNELNPNNTGRVFVILEEALSSPAFATYVMRNPNCFESLSRAMGHAFGSVEEVRNWLKIEHATYLKTYSDITNGPLYHGIYQLGFIESSFFQGTACGEMFTFKVYDGKTKIYDFFDDSIPPYSLVSPKRSLYISNPSVSFAEKTSDGQSVVLGRDYYKIVADIKERGLSEWRKLLYETIKGDLEEPSKNGAEDIDKKDWAFKQSGVAEQISFNNCAEGIKSLIGLNILDRYGLIDSDSLIVIDEPEVHLHPQWIVACAKILITLVREVKARVLIATHSPYMVQAIRNLAVGQLSSNQYKFYLSKPVGDGVHYEYENLNHNIGPIFESFNVALEDIALYED